MSTDIHALSGAYAVDALDDAERAQFEQHLAGCSACQAEVQSLAAAATELSELSDWAPPAGLRDRVLHGITLVRPLPPIVAADTHAGGDTVGSSIAAPVIKPAVTEPAVTDELATRRARRAENRPSPMRWLVAAATAAVLVVGGFTAWRSTTGQDAAPPPTVAEQVRTADDATTSRAVTFPGGGSATIVRSPSVGKAVMITSNMASPPTGKVYQLWLQDRNGHFDSAGLMSASGNQTVVLQGNAAVAQAAGITIEPAGGSPQPTSNPIAFYSFA